MSKFAASTIIDELFYNYLSYAIQKYGHCTAIISKTPLLV